MSEFFAFANAYVLTAVAALVVGVVFSQKIKDWFKGIPSVARAELQKVENEAVKNLQALQVSAVHSAAAAVGIAPANVPTPVVEPPKAA